MINKYMMVFVSNIQVNQNPLKIINVNNVIIINNKGKSIKIKQKSNNQKNFKLMFNQLKNNPIF